MARDDVLWGRQGVELVPKEKSKDKYAVLSNVEKQIMTECLDEAFYYRSLPFALSFSLGTVVLVEQGLILPFQKMFIDRVPRPIVKWGLAACAGALGFVLGQASYSNQCSRKFLTRAPDGVVAMDIKMKAGLQAYPYSILSPINQAKWRELARIRERENLDTMRSIDPGFNVDPEFRDQNVLSANVREGRDGKDEGPVRYGMYDRKYL